MSRENRLTLVQYDPGAGGLTSVASYRYDALGRRALDISGVAARRNAGVRPPEMSRVRFDPNQVAANNVTLHYYHDGQNMVAEYLYDNAAQTLTRSYVHGAQYIDERAVMRDHAGNGQDHYYLLAELYNVAGLVNAGGQPEEVYIYDTYGHVTVWDWPIGDITGDGGVDVSDLTAVKLLLWSNCSPWADVNLDGWIDSGDFTDIKNHRFELLEAVTYSSVDNPYFFTGRISDTLHASDLLVENDPDFRRVQDNRNRMYDPHHGRWLQRDPARYADSMNSYQYVNSRPTSYVDWSGDQASQPAPPASQPPGPQPAPPPASQPPGSQPAPPPASQPPGSQPAGSQPAGGELERCRALLSISLKDAGVQRLLKLMKDKGCPDPSPTCRCCPGYPNHKGYYQVKPSFQGDPDVNKAFICVPQVFEGLEGVPPEWQHPFFTGYVIHELSHACHFCLDPFITKTDKMKQGACAARVCSELAAYANEGVCKNVGGGEKSRVRGCYYNKVSGSIMIGTSYGVCNTKTIFDQAFDVLYDKCRDLNGPCEKALKGP